MNSDALNSTRVECSFGILARLRSDNARSIALSSSEARCEDSIVAIAHNSLHFFSRSPVNSSLACPCLVSNPDSKNDLEKLLPLGFLCPHVSGYDDFRHFATIPLTVIQQILLTFRDVAILPLDNAVKSTLKLKRFRLKRKPKHDQMQLSTDEDTTAEHTCKLYLKLKDSTTLQLIFEHNIMRSSFVDAIMSTYSSVEGSDGIIGIESINEIDEWQLPVQMNWTLYPPCIPHRVALQKEPVTSSCLTDSPGFEDDRDDVYVEKLFNFTRDVMRLAIVEKIKTALQIALDPACASCESSNTSCHFLLATAMTLSQQLDEPDLNTFTWLGSGYINMQTSNYIQASTINSPSKFTLATPQPHLQTSTNAKRKSALALSQVMFSLDQARKNSLTYFTFMSLHCAADLYLMEGDKDKAIEYLREAMKYMPQDLDTTMKTQIHHKLENLCPSTSNELSLVTNDLPKSESSKKKITKQSAFNLWIHSFGSPIHDDQSRPLSPKTKARKKKMFKIEPKSPRWSSDKKSKTGMLKPKQPPIAISSTSNTEKPIKNGKIKRTSSSTRKNGSCYIELIDTKVNNRCARFRVFFQGKQTCEWLGNEVLRRYLCACTLPNPENLIITGLYKQNATELPLNWSSQLGDILMKDNIILWALLDTKKTSLPPQECVESGSSVNSNEHRQSINKLHPVEISHKISHQQECPCGDECSFTQCSLHNKKI